MPTIRGSGLIRDLASIPCADEALRRRGRYRRDAIDLLEREDLLEAAYCYRIVPLEGARRAAAGAGARAIDGARHRRLDARSGAGTAGKRAVRREAHVAGAGARQTG